MPKKINQFMLLLMVVTVMMSSAIGTTTVYADDGTTGESSEPAGAEVAPGEVAPGDEVAPPEPSNDEGIVVDEGQTPPEETVISADEQSFVEEPVLEEPVSVAEILEQDPEGTELVVVNEAGQVEPLVTEAAAEIIATGDPMWCPDGITPGGTGCTGSHTTFASLISTLASGLYSGNGVIWVEDSYNGNDNSQIVFNGTTLSTLANSNLTIQGGWSGGNNTTINPNATSQTDVSMVFVNWAGNITLNDLDIAATDGAGFGLFTNTTGNVTMNNVSVNNTTVSASGVGDGAILNTTGNVDINDSEFNGNHGNGLQVQSTGTIKLDTASATGNTSTGADLDSCRYGTVTSGLCAGSGAVTITSLTTNLFNGNGFNGLVVDAGGGIAIDHTQVNANGLNGADLMSKDNDGTGNVTVTQSEFNANANATGLKILTDGSLGLTNVNAYSNGTGAVLNTTDGVGAINVTDSNFGVDNATGNTWTGLHAESGGLIELDNVEASYNGTNGAYLEAKGNITVTDSRFNNNVESNYPQDPGLYAKSNGGGNIALTNVTADNNVYGAGAVLNTSGTGAITVIGGAGHFNGNGTFGVQAQSGDGNITLNGVTASFNKVKGAYLSSYGLGNIFINNNSTFVENGSYGIYASTSKGNINLDDVTVTGDNGVDDGAVGADDLTDYGAVLTTGNGGEVNVTDSDFNLNTGVGLKIIASGKVDLVNVTADQNGGNGVEVYSTYTASCRCPESKVVNVAVNVDGTFTDNTGYGLMVKPGPEGTLVISPSTTFGGNGLGEYLLDLSEPADCEKCGCDEPPTETKKPNVVQVPFVNGEPVEQDCDLFSSTVLELPDGTWANVGCPYTGFSKLESLEKEKIPGSLGAGANYLAGVILSLTDGEGNAILNEDGTVTITFKINEDSRSRSYSVLFWDPELNDGKGGWIQLPLFEAGTSFPLHPDDPEDGRVITSGVKQVGDTITFTVNFPGIFVLTAR